MTLHIAFVCPSFVMQIGDRLLTYEKGGTRSDWDTYANKTIMVLAKNGLVAVSYAGLAHIDKKPTDEWLLGVIASTNSEVDLDDSNRSSWFGLRLNVTLGQMCEAIKAAVLERFLGQTQHQRGQGIEILVTGWTWPRRQNGAARRPSTFSRFISHDGRRGTPCREEKMKSYAYRTAHDLTQGFIWAVGNPSERILEEVFSALRAAGDHLTPDDVEAVLAKKIRDNAGLKNSGIGMDLMSIYMPIIGDLPRIRYLRNEAQSKTLTVYTPAFIATSGMISPPQILEGGGGMSFVFNPDTPSEWEIKVEAIPPIPPRTGLSSARGQPRPSVLPSGLPGPVAQSADRPTRTQRGPRRSS